MTTEKLSETIQRAFSKKERDYIMTLAERLKEEGRIEGEKKGRRKGLRDAIELGLTLKFPHHLDDVMNQVKEIRDLEVLTNIKKAIKTAEDISEILKITDAV